MKLLTTLVVLLLIQSSALAQRPPRGSDGPATQPSEDKLSVREHTLRAGDHTLDYRSTCGTIAIKDEAGKHKADFFFTAYEVVSRDGSSTATTVPSGKIDPARPITFVFNGGPGASSVWLHLGVVGPKRIDFPDDGVPGAPPYRLVENEASWLPFTDVVLIDPVGTGFSRPAAGEDGKQFWGVEQDAASVADFIRLWLTRYNRWESPKFLAGESYGTTRAARLSEFLADRHGVNLNGIVLVSAVLNFQTIRPSDTNDLPYVLYLPTYTYVAAYHKKLAPELTADLQKTLREVEAFAIGEYQTALTRGATLPADQRKALAEKLARYTGLPQQLIEDANLRISPSMFQKRILAGSRQVIGRFDGRMTGFDPNPLGNSPAFDPSYNAYNGPYSSCFNAYVRGELKFESDLPYEILTGRVQPWDYGPAGNGFLNVSDEMRSAMVKYPHMKVLVAEGMFDFATPYFASDYTINSLDLSPDLRANITQTYYPGGHMMYHVTEARRQLTADVQAFFASCLEQKR
jgi:carboxypeptidase C (cathepsin A)